MNSSQIKSDLYLCDWIVYPTIKELNALEMVTNEAGAFVCLWKSTTPTRYGFDQWYRTFTDSYVRAVRVMREQGVSAKTWKQIQSASRPNIPPIAKPYLRFTER